jgi:EAL and modified HD-GYP domain-containing signal transduction protein
MMAIGNQHPVIRAQPLINVKRQYGGMRLVIDDIAPGSNDLAETLSLFAEWEAGAKYPVILAFANPTWPQSLGNWQPPTNTYIEMHGDWLPLAAARAVLTGSNDLFWCLSGEPGLPLDPALRATLAYTVHDSAVSGGLPASVGKARVRTGVATLADADAAFASGDHWVAGWPLLPAVAPAPKRRSESRAIVMRLMQLAQQDADITELDAVLKQDVGLAFKLLRYINSPAVGLSVQVQSLQHAVMILGYKRLVRWLSLLLMASSDDPNHVPLMRISLRRAFFMERIGIMVFDDTKHDELFITGLFSLLDLVFAQPFSELLDQLHLPEAVADSLTDHGEPYGALLRLAESIEGNDAQVVGICAQYLGLEQSEVNRALLLAIRDADEVELG